MTAEEFRQLYKDGVYLDVLEKRKYNTLVKDWIKKELKVERVTINLSGNEGMYPNAFLSVYVNGVKEFAGTIYPFQIGLDRKYKHIVEGLEQLLKTYHCEILSNKRNIKIRKALK